jgi:hypothetical protein
VSVEKEKKNILPFLALEKQAVTDMIQKQS